MKYSEKRAYGRRHWLAINLIAYVTMIAVIAGVGWVMTPTALRAEDVKVYKNTGCQCCARWANRLGAEGNRVTEISVDDLDAIKKRYHVPEKFQGCHTALIGSYVIEGHVPMKEIDRLLRERPDAKGLSVAGMPVGSPGMEVPGEKADTYKVMLMKKDGTSEVYAQY